MGDKAGQLPSLVSQSLYSGVYLSFICIMHHVCPAEDKLHSVWQWSAVYIRCTVWARVCVRTGRNTLTENPVLAGWLTLSWHVGPSHCSHMTTQQNSAHARMHAHTHTHCALSWLSPHPSPVALPSCFAEWPMRNEVAKAAALAPLCF